jgi:hypothetical protein
MSFAIWDAGNPAELAAWTGLWERWPGREVWAHPHYARLFAQADQQTLAAVWEGDDGGVIYPFILRPLSALEWNDDDDPRCDLVTPYGYGGAFAWGRQEHGFWDAFDAWAAGIQLVSGFTRLSLFADQLLPFRGEVGGDLPNVIRSLDLDDDALWRDYAHKVRKNVNRARREELTVSMDTTGERLGDFLRIYAATMDRRDAAEGYYFGDDFFRAIVDELPGQWLLAHVLDGDAVVSTELVLLSQDSMYSFLGGTVSAAFPKRPNDLLKHELSLWGRRNGKKAYVLGGGYGGPDGIFKYKKGFAPGGVVTFQSGRRVFDEKAHNELCARRRQSDPAWAPRDGFFPQYRG